jgi:hypothetical protein
MGRVRLVSEMVRGLLELQQEEMRLMGRFGPAGVGAQPGCHMSAGSRHDV